ncbi:Rho termination factor N-terminal domain-containing protein, partial [Christiangramia marina]|uniref:Rho termination factor N-terminal domain-containing protein n=1 Tax=Christiangramia marina TaxID=409436 RepID=UPI003AA8064B
MFEISELKAKKLPELKEIAQSLNVPKYKTLKKLDLVYQILDYQAANPAKVKEVLTEDSAEPAKQETTKPSKVGSEKKPAKPAAKAPRPSRKESDPKEDKKEPRQKSTRERSSSSAKTDDRKKSDNRNDNRNDRNDRNDSRNDR